MVGKFLKESTMIFYNYKLKSARPFILNGIFCFLFILIAFLPQFAFASQINEQNLISLTNAERIKYGLTPLALDTNLKTASLNKAVDMISNNYFDHFSPSGKTPWYFINNAHYDYTYAGENLAMDFRTAEGVVKAWMDSPTHRANILNSRYDDIAISVINGEIDNHETTLVVQMFGKKDISIFAKSNDLANRILNSILGYNLLNK